MKSPHDADRLVIPPESVALNPSRDSAWVTALLTFVENAARQGKTVTAQVSERTLSPRQAAELADVSRATILRRIEDGTISASKRGTHWRISESEMARYRHTLLIETTSVMANDWRGTPARDTAGVLDGAHPPGYLDDLRQDWPA